MATVTVVITILNEEHSLPSLFKSLEKQVRKPDEVIVVDGGSHDVSTQLLAAWHPKFPVKWLVKRGNRAEGRNAGIEKSRSSMIAITDAGCRPEKTWLKEIVRPLGSGTAEVVAGYYRAQAETPFEQAAAAYMLVMPEMVDETNFLPATRSMAMLKSSWKKAGKFPSVYAHNEDYVFAHALRKTGVKMEFARKAVVNWTPPQTWGRFLHQVGRFAYGDAQAGILRPKVVSIFLRWAILILAGLASFKLFVAMLSLYALWAFLKNRRYVKSLAGVRILPLMQVATDVVVMGATIWGLLHQIHEKSH